MGDSVDNRYEMLIYDCYQLMEQKSYMNSIRNMTQAFEMFFSLFLRVELLYKPFGVAANHELTLLNDLSEALHSKIGRHTFVPMRSLFLQHLVTGRSPQNLIEAKLMVAALPDKPKAPKDATLDNIKDRDLVLLARKLKTTRIHEIRNRIVHKMAYRPTREEAETYFKETRDLLNGLTTNLKLYDDVNWYMVSR